MRNEYDRLLESVFTNPEAIKDIVRLLYTRNAGFTRKEITQKLGITEGGTLSKNLSALISSDFVVKYVLPLDAASGKSTINWWTLFACFIFTLFREKAG